MNRFALLIGCGLLALIPGRVAAEDGFQVVFDGTDLSKVTTEGNWQIQEDGSLYLEPRPGETGWKRYHHYLWVNGDYADFTFDFEFKYEEGGNSGFYFRVADEADPVTSGFEVQILDCHGAEKELGKHDMGGIIKTAGPLANGCKPAGEWNRMVVTLQGSKLTVELNGTLVQDKLDLATAKPADKVLAPSGKLSIQDHGLKFWVRNLKVKRL
jgi:hypothetical protein